MFKLESPVDRYLFVKGHLVWHIRPSLDSEKELVRSGGAMRRCPAHPCNFSLHMGLVSIDNWQFDKVGDYRNTSFEEGGVLVRCSVHDAEHGRWLVEQGREGLMDWGWVYYFISQLQNSLLSAVLLLTDNKTCFIAFCYPILPNRDVSPALNWLKISPRWDQLRQIWDF